VTTCLEDYCGVLQEIGFPAARIKTERVEIVEFNELFKSLLTAGSAQRDAHTFIEGVLRGIISTDRDRSDVILTDRPPASVLVQLQSVNGQASNFEMRTIAPVGSAQTTKSIICVFIPIAGPVFDRIRDEHLSEGEESERLRFRNELHKGISQQLLGAAFGCKALATKIGRLNDELGKEATELADLINAAVAELQAVVQSERNRP
jgi:signal transduction histidine kinase